MYDYILYFVLRSILALIFYIERWISATFTNATQLLTNLTCRYFYI